jgi:hypothetical protein
MTTDLPVPDEDHTPATSGFAAFRRAVSKEAVAYVRRDVDFDAPDFKEVMNNHILGLPGPKSLSRNLTRDQEYFRAIRKIYQEVEYSFDSIRDLEVYLQEFPFTGADVTRSRYLRRTIETYFSEVYILNQRLLSFLPVLRKKFKYHPEAAKLKKAIQSLELIVKDVFRPTVDVRGSHVHEVRYIDDDLDRLDTLELLLFGGDDLQITALYEAHYQKLCTSWGKVIRDSSRTYGQLLDHYFDALAPYLLNNGDLAYPPAPVKGEG